MSSEDELSHPAVAIATLTCCACPVQYSGRFVDGRFFYFRYRFGRASLAAGRNRDGVEGRQDVVVAHGDAMQGCFDSEHERDLVFAKLYELLEEDEKNLPRTS